MRTLGPALLIVGVTAGCASLESEVGEVGSGTPYRSEVLPSHVVDAGILAGRVISAETGEVLGGVQVWVIGTPTGAISQGDGSFVLTHLPDQEILLLGVSLIGFRQDTMRVRQQRGLGLAARLAMRPGPICLCNGNPFDAARGLFIVDVRNAVTAEPPASAVLEVHWRGGVASDRQDRQAADRLILGAGPPSPGEYHVRVTAAGYEPWARDVVIQRDCCGDIRHRYYTVWLLPLSGTGR